MSGPPPKKERERRRTNKDGIETQVINIDELVAGEVEIPMPPERADDCKDECDPDCEKHTGEMVPSWHPVAHEAYWSLAKSGQVIFMEPSDWMTAYTLCEALSRELRPKPMTTMDSDGATTLHWVTSPVNGAVMNAFLKGWASLLATEGDRRRLRIELERKKRIDAAASDLGVVVDIVQARADSFKQQARG